MYRVITYLFLFITSAVGVIAQDNVEQLAVTLKNQKYQALPTDVYSVFVDQGKRVWYLLRIARPREPFGVPECKAEIKAQFGKKQPALKLSEPVLLGPGKMIWFKPKRNPDSPTLAVIGYDGTKFVDFESTDKVYIEGTRETNLRTPAAQFFLTNKGVLVYHKGDFSHCFLGFTFSISLLSYDPKSKQVLAVKGGSNAGGDDPDLESVHLWKDGEWRKLALPKPEKGLRHAFFHQGKVEYIRKNRPVVLGKYTCKSPTFLCYHENDMYVTAKDILVDNKSQGPGIVIAKADGSYAALPLKDPPTRKTKRGIVNPPLMCDGKMWYYMNGVTCVLDLKTGKIVDRHETGGFGAVSGNRIYLGGFPLCVYKPDAPETRQALPVLKTVEGRREFSEDGALYIHVPTKHKTFRAHTGESFTNPSEYRYDYYDGKERHELPNLRFKFSLGCMMGRNHTFIDTGGKGKARWRLLKDGKVIDASTFFELIQKNKDLISRNISDARLSSARIVTNGPNQVWATQGDGLKALSGNTWIDIDAELKKRGLERDYFTQMDNRCMYLSAFSRGRPKEGRRIGAPEKWKGFVASIDSGKLKLQPAPFGHGAGRGHVGHFSDIRDPEALWLNAVDSKDGNSYHGKPMAIRISSKGVLQTIKHKGHASVYDKIGNVWIGIRSPYYTVDRGIYYIWRDGKIVSSIRIPGGNQQSVFLSDKAGSVYVWTELGIHHYVTNRQDPTKYSLRKTYYIPSVETRGPVKFSQRGFFVIRRGEKTSIVTLPKK